MTIEEAHKQLIVKALDMSKTKKEAAKRLGITEGTLQTKLKQYYEENSANRRQASN